MLLRISSKDLTAVRSGYRSRDLLRQPPDQRGNYVLLILCKTKVNKTYMDQSSIG